MNDSVVVLSLVLVLAERAERLCCCVPTGDDSVSEREFKEFMTKVSVVAISLCSRA